MARVGQQRAALEHVVDDDRLEHVELEVPARAGEADRGVVAHHVHADHRHRLGLRRVHLARHDAAPRLVLRQVQLADAAARAAAEQAHVARDLEARDGQGAQRAAGRDERLVPGERRELVRGRAKRRARERRRSRSATPSAHFGCVLRPVPTAVPPSASSYSPSSVRSSALSQNASCAAQPLNSCPSVSGVASIRWVRPTLTMSLNSSLFASMPLRSAATAGQEALLDLERHGHVHHRREHVVRRLRAVHVVVGVNGLLRAHRPAGELDRAVRDDLVRVHVRLRAAPGLPDDQREVRVERAGDDLVGRAHDEVALGRVELAQVLVGERRRLLHDAEGADDGATEAVAADLEVLQAALRLGAPVLVRAHFDLAHAVGLDAHVHGWDALIGPFRAPVTWSRERRPDGRPHARAKRGATGTGLSPRPSRAAARTRRRSPPRRGSRPRSCCPGGTRRPCAIARPEPRPVARACGARWPCGRRSRAVGRRGCRARVGDGDADAVAPLLGAMTTRAPRRPVNLIALPTSFETTWSKRARSDRARRAATGATRARGARRARAPSARRSGRPLAGSLRRPRPAGRA